MEYIIVSSAAFIASMLTLFSGFGLGTLLMPVIAIFFPVEMAVAITAMVHLANNIFKVGLLGKAANRSVLMRFGIPAIIAALSGAVLLTWLSGAAPVYEYQAFGRGLQVAQINLVVGLLILAFVLLELWPRFASISLAGKYLPYGGALSGFFGGLSGHQGAFRSMFLLKAGLSKDEFIATGVILAIMVDIPRMAIYGIDLAIKQRAVAWPLVAAASLAAFVGAYAGSRLLKTITIRSIQLLVSILLIILSLGLISGVL